MANGNDKDKAPEQAPDFIPVSESPDFVPPPQKDIGVYAELSKASGLSPQPKMFSRPWWKSKGINWGLDVADALPAAGGMIGGVAGGMASGGLGAVGGAGIGGMGGAAGKQLMYRALGWPAPATSDEAAKEIMKGGAVQAAIQIPSELMPMAAGTLNKMATRQYERALAPTTKVNKAITQKIVPEMMDRGVKGNLGKIELRAGEEASRIKPELDVAYTRTPATATAGSGTQIVRDLEALKGKYTVQGMPANPTAVKAISDVQDVVKQYGSDIAPDSLRKLKGIFDESVAARGGYAGGDLTTAYTLKAQKAAANSIREIMGTANPDVAALNKELTFWLNVQRVTKQSGLRQTGQAGGLMKVLGPLATGAATGMGFMAGGTYGSIEAGGIAALTTMATQLVRTPAWRTMSAVAKDRFADALARGSVGEVSALAARFGITIGTASTRPSAQPTRMTSPLMQ